MAGFGFGIGGFASGLASGIDEGMKIKSFKQQQKLAKIKLSALEKQQQDQANAKDQISKLLKGDSNLPSSSAQQPTENNSALLDPNPIETGEQLTTQAIKSGKVQPQNAPTFFAKNFAHPIAMHLAANGQPQQAQQFLEWGDTAHAQDVANKMGDVALAGVLAKRDGNINPLSTTIRSLWDSMDPQVTKGLKFQTITKSGDGGYTMTFGQPDGKRVTDKFDNMDAMLAYVQNYAHPYEYWTHHQAAQKGQPQPGAAPQAQPGQPSTQPQPAAAASAAPDQKVLLAQSKAAPQPQGGELGDVMPGQQPQAPKPQPPANRVASGFDRLPQSKPAPQSAPQPQPQPAPVVNRTPAEVQASLPTMPTADAPRPAPGPIARAASSVQQPPEGDANSFEGVPIQNVKTVPADPGTVLQGKAQPNSNGVHGLSPQMREQLATALTSTDPEVQAVAKEILARSLPPAKWSIQKSEDGSIIAINQANPQQYQVVYKGNKQKLMRAGSDIVDMSNPAQPRVVYKGDVSSEAAVTLDADAERYRQTGTLPPNMGRGQQGQRLAAAIRTRAAEQEIAAGGNPQNWPERWAQYQGEKSYQRTGGTYGMRVEAATNEVEQALPLALDASRNLPRGPWVPWNKLRQSWEQGTSDPAYNDFVVKNFSLINAYTRAMNPSGQPRITERLEQKADNILSKATSPQAYEVQLRALWQEVQRSKGAIANARKGLAPVENKFPGDASMPDTKASDPLGIDSKEPHGDSKSSDPLGLFQ